MAWRGFDYFQDASPVETISLDKINVTLQGQTGHPNGMQIIALIKGKSRNIFVYAEQGLVSYTLFSIVFNVPCRRLFIGFVPSELLG